uniref:Uncharacterized protein n=2 Tax=Canis lupus familiaris TaxID=9615 RepID=A0A8C0Z129_CANLF
IGPRQPQKADARDQGALLILSFKEKQREYLICVPNRKSDRSPKKEAQKLCEEGHQEYLKMLAERGRALEVGDELQGLVTTKTKPVQYDHPNQSHSHCDHHQRQGPVWDLPEQGTRLESMEAALSMEKPTRAIPRKSRASKLPRHISSLTSKHPGLIPDSTKKYLRIRKTQPHQLRGKAPADSENQPCPSLSRLRSGPPHLHAAQFS